MREEFAEYCHDADFDCLWSDGTIVLDTSALCDLYRMDRPLRHQCFRVLRELSEQLWIPHQVGLEYYRNRRNVANGVAKSVGSAKGTVDDIKRRLSEQLRQAALPNPEELEEHFEDLTEAVDSLSDSLRNAQEDVLSADEDAVRDELEELFDGRVGPAPSEKKLEKDQQEAEERQKKGIPPGHTDSKDKNATYIYDQKEYASAFGDYLLWAQTLRKCERDDISDLLLVTSDGGEDWFEVAEDGKWLGPNRELIREAKAHGIENFHVNRTEQFFRHADEQLDIDVDFESGSRFSSFIDGTEPTQVSAASPEWSVFVAIQTVGRWLKSEYGEQNVHTSRGALHFIVDTEETGREGVVVSYPGLSGEEVSNEYLDSWLENLRSRGYQLNRLTWFTVCDTPARAHQALKELQTIDWLKVASVGYCVGVLEEESENQVPVLVNYSRKRPGFLF